MSDTRDVLLELCLRDQLFCSLYRALLRMERVHGAPAPQTIWVEALGCMRRLSGSVRPDLLAEGMFADLPVVCALCVNAVVFCMVMAGDMGHGREVSALKDALCRLLSAHGELWAELFTEMQHSEAEEERHGNHVRQCDYSLVEIPVTERVEEDDVHDVVEHLVDITLGMNNPQVNFGMELVLNRLNVVCGYKYNSCLERLMKGTDAISTQAHSPRQVGSIIGTQNNYAALPPEVSMKQLNQE